MTSVKSGRNDACPCGSGEKYKKCCAVNSDARSRGLSRFQVGMMIVVVAVAVGGALYLNFGRREGISTASTAAVASPAERAAAPSVPGAVQPGAPQAAPGATTATPGAQPPGPAPTGKVWAAEHGHWHDVAAPTPVQIQMNAPIGAGRPATGVAPIPTSPAARPQATPDGKVWSVDHGHWHDVEKNGRVSDIRVMGRPIDQGSMTGSIPQPAGAVPPGKVWSQEHGHWHDGSGNASEPKTDTSAQ